MTKNKNDKKENKLGFVVLIASVLILALAVSYAIWAQTYHGKKENKMNTATLILTLDESASKGISLLNTVPVTDEKGVTFDPYTFTVQNSGTTEAKYRILLVNDENEYQKHGCSDLKLDWSNIRYSFAKDKEAATVGNLGETGGVLNEGILKVDAKSSYSLKLWIKAEATNEIMNRHFHGIIKVEAIQSDQELPVND